MRNNEATQEEHQEVCRFIEAPPPTTPAWGRLPEPKSPVMFDPIILAQTQQQQNVGNIRGNGRRGGRTGGRGQLVIV